MERASSAGSVSWKAAERVNLSAQALIAIRSAFVDASLCRINFVQAAVLHRGKIRHDHIRACLEPQLASIDFVDRGQRRGARMFVSGHAMRVSAIIL